MSVRGTGPCRDHPSAVISKNIRNSCPICAVIVVFIRKLYVSCWSNWMGSGFVERVRQCSNGSTMLFISTSQMAQGNRGGGERGEGGKKGGLCASFPPSSQLFPTPPLQAPATDTSIGPTLRRTRQWILYKLKHSAKRQLYEFLLFLNRKMKESKSGNLDSLFSPTFTTSRHGYRLCASVCLNGDGKGKGTHMSVFISVLKGRVIHSQSFE